MSSQLAVQHNAAPQPASAGLAQAEVQRAGALAQRIALHIETLVPRGRARCLDVGNGDTTLAEAVQARAPRTEWRCLDVHGPAASQYDGATMPFSDREFDIALLCDVLHDTPASAARVLAEAGRVAKRVLVKDHFEYGPYSRAMLRLMDCVGHRGSAARRHFTREGFTRLAAEQSFVITALDCGLSLYEHSPIARAVLRPDCDFIAVLRRTESPAPAAAH